MGTENEEMYRDDRGGFFQKITPIFKHNERGSIERYNNAKEEGKGNYNTFKIM